MFKRSSEDIDRDQQQCGPLEYEPRVHLQKSMAKEVWKFIHALMDENRL